LQERRREMGRMGRFVGILSALAALVLLGATAALAQGNSINQGKHTICHATGSESNPFVTITPAKAGVFNGHLGDGHQLGEDIIPPFEYDSDRDGTPEEYSQNWPEGEAIFDNGCELVSEGPGPGGNPPPPPPGGEGGGAGGAGAGGGALGEVAGSGAQGAQGALPFTGIPAVFVGLAALVLLVGGVVLMRRNRTDG
jgi:hypothetical protein